MNVKPILRMGHPLLNQVASTTDLDDPALDRILGEMRASMQAHNGVGLAAPQIGIDQRIVIFGLEKNPRYPDAGPVPYTVLINPEITPLSEEMNEGWEGCLSLPGMRGLVPRFQRIHYCGYDERGQRIEREAEGFHARVVQHECDHLDGILYPQRITDLSKFGYIEELEQAGLIDKVED